MPPTNLLQHIDENRPLLRKSEHKVADYVAAHPANVIHISIADLAAHCGVSEPTVLRFCRAIGCHGFQDFKLQLAQSLASGASFGQFEVTGEESTGDFKQMVFNTTISNLIDIRDQLDSAQLEQAIALLSQAQRIEFYGYGASGIVATDAQHKFFRLQVTTAAYSDPHMQSMSAGTLTPDDVVIAISQTGRTKELLHVIQLVQKQMAKVIALCPSNTPMASACDIHVPINVPENTDIYTPLTSRIAHLVVIDVLAMGVAMSRGPELAQQLRTVKKNLRSLRLTQK